MQQSRSKRLRINFVSAGQTPRKRMVYESLSHHAHTCEVHEFGALDGLSDRDIQELSPAVGELSIRTKLRTGEDAVISETWLRTRLDDICGQLNSANSDDITIVGTTKSLVSENVPDHILQAEIALQKTIETLSIAGQRIGEIVTLPIQLHEGRRFLDADFDAAYASPKDQDALAEAGRKLSHCDFIVLGSMAHPLKHHEIVAKSSGKPVIHIRKVLAGTLARALREREKSSIAQVQLLVPDWQDTVNSLSEREKQVLECVLNGLSNKNIARILGISHRTVEVHRRNIMGKFGVANARDLMGSLNRALSFNLPR
nr:AroM family protein [Roseibium sp.]